MKPYRPFLQWQHTLAAQSNGAIVSSVCENAYMQEEWLKWPDSNYSECFQPLNKSCRINIRQDFTRLPANDVAFCISITYPTAKFVTWIFFFFFGYWVKGEKVSRKSLQTALGNYCKGKFCQDLQNCFLFRSFYPASGLLGFPGMNIAELSCDPLALLPSICCMHISFFSWHFNSFEHIWLMRGRWRTDSWLKQLPEQTLRYRRSSSRSVSEILFLWYYGKLGQLWKKHRLNWNKWFKRTILQV